MAHHPAKSGPLDPAVRSRDPAVATPHDADLDQLAQRIARIEAAIAGRSPFLHPLRTLLDRWMLSHLKRMRTDLELRGVGISRSRESAPSP